MALFLSQYLYLLIFIFICSIFAFLFFFLSYAVATQNADTEKVSSYECGFDPFNDARNTFDVRFYLVAILFIIFDLEVSFLFPWCICIGSLPILSFWSMLLFLFILTTGFVYEWKKGALEWE